MIIGICATWARIKRVVSEDTWFYCTMLAMVEIMFELGTILLVAL